MWNMFALFTNRYDQREVSLDGDIVWFCLSLDEEDGRNIVGTRARNRIVPDSALHLIISTKMSALAQMLTGIATASGIARA